ncbi:Histone-lysine N-methyltransferase ASHH2 [Linum perenne]
MGSCEDAVVVHDLVNPTVAGQHSSCEEFGASGAADVNPASVVDFPAGNDNAGSVSSRDDVDTATVEDEVVGDGSVTGKLLENGSEVISETCPSMNHIGYVDCNGDTEGVCSGKVEENGCESDEWLNDGPAELMVDDLGTEKDDVSGGVQMDVGEEMGTFYETEIDTQQDLFPSLDHEMPEEVDCFSGDLSNVENRQPECDISIARDLGVNEKSTAGLVGKEMVSEHQNLGSLPSALETVESMHHDCIQDDNQKNQPATSSSSKGSDDDVEGKDDVLVGLETTSVQLSSDGSLEMSKLSLKIESVQTVVDENVSYCSDSPLKDAEGIKEKEHDPLIFSENVSIGQASSSVEQVMCSAGGPVSNDCPKQNELGTRMISGLTSGRIEDGESDASADREVDISTWISSYGDELPLKEPANNACMISFEKKAYQENDRPGTYPFIKIDRNDEEVSRFVSVSPLIPCERPLEYLPTAESLGICNQHVGEMNDRNVDIPSAESTSEVMEEMFDNLTAKVVRCAWKVTTAVKEEITKIPTTAGVEELALSPTQQLCENKGKNHDRTDCISDTELPHSQSCASLQSSRPCRSSRKPRSTKGKNKGKKVSDFKKKRKRSFVPKRTRVYEWGLLGNVMEYFKVIDELGDDEKQKSRSRKERQGKQKENKNKAAGPSGESFKTRIRLKVKVGKAVNTGVPVDASTSTINGDRDEAAEQKRKDHQCKQEKVTAESDASVVDAYYQNNQLEGTVSDEKSIEVAAGDYLDPALLGGGLEVSRERTCAGSGTSPESEVINVVPEIQVGSQCPQYIPNRDSASLQISSSSGLLPDNSGGKKKTKKKKSKSPCVDNCSKVDELPVAGSTGKEAKSAKKKGARQRKSEKSYHCDMLASSITEKVAGNSSSRKDISAEQLPSSEEAELTGPREVCDGDSSVKTKPSGTLGTSDGFTQRRSKKSSSGKGRRSSSSKQNLNEEGAISKVDATIHAPADKGVELDMERVTIQEYTSLTDVGSVDDLGKELDTVPKQLLPMDSAWAHCDDCHKWRRIPVELVQTIGQNDQRWTCTDNVDKEYADCSIPQEKSNSEINAELGISDGDEDSFDIPLNSKGLESKQIVSNEHEFTRIRTNQFLHRRRKTQNIDEVMICHCKPPVDGRFGCGDECLNRMLNIECVQGTCPCGDLCSNQQFQRQTYAKMSWDRCGKKGFGLRMQEDISKGKFLIEYVGEVLDMRAYEARQKEYAVKGHKHFYFMTLDGSEVIDACAKGNLGRFINHSCDPNCRTEKWVVNGEICIGMFAVRNIKKGEELTFDYNYVRVFGAAAKKCYCGSSLCRGYIGGDPTNYEVVDQVDSDEEFPEPVMFEEGRNAVKKSSSAKMRIAESISAERGNVDGPVESLVKGDVSSNIGTARSKSPDVSQSLGSLQVTDIKANDQPCQSVEISCQAEETTRNPSDIEKDISMEEAIDKSSSYTQVAEKPTPVTTIKSSSDGTDAKKKSKSSEEKRVFVKSRFLIKGQSGSTKKGKLNGIPQTANRSQTVASKLQVQPANIKRAMEGVPNGRLETVEEKLNELLDDEGGITKRKDAVIGYLKLLLLTTASGAGANGEAIQSNRDLSMILDAILKTRSRAVLTDIISKNGLQMLHNIIKRYRSDFNKIPIVRKLLKVIEYLAGREILTNGNIYGAPPRPGMESFRESMLSLTEHEDRQVHWTARNFRDKWFPRQRFEAKRRTPDKEEGRNEFRRGFNYNKTSTMHSRSHDHSAKSTEVMDRVIQSKVATTSSDSAVVQSEVPSSSLDRSVNEVGCSAPSTEVGGRTRKRKSRWDQPFRSNHGFHKTNSDASQQPSQSNPEVGKVQDDVDICHRDEASGPVNLEEDLPPGFASNPSSSVVSCDSSPAQKQNTCVLNHPVEDIIGDPQKKFNSSLPVSYGIPWHIVQQFGTPADEAGNSWVVAPGIPFHPFPPLPPTPYPKSENPDCGSGPVHYNEKKQANHEPGGYPTVNAAVMNTYNNADSARRMVNQSNGGGSLGKRYFKQRKWNRRSPWDWKYEGNRTSHENASSYNTSTTTSSSSQDVLVQQQPNAQQLQK